MFKRTVEYSFVRLGQLPRLVYDGNKLIKPRFAANKQPPHSWTLYLFEPATYPRSIGCLLLIFLLDYFVVIEEFVALEYGKDNELHEIRITFYRKFVVKTSTLAFWYQSFLSGGNFSRFIAPSRYSFDHYHEAFIRQVAVVFPDSLESLRDKWVTVI